MGLFNEMVSNIKKIVVSDEDDNLFSNDDMFNEKEDKEKEKKTLTMPFARKNNETKLQGIDFDLNNFSINTPKQENKKMQNKGHIQVYIPKSFDQAFDIIRDVKTGTTAMVNVEVCNMQMGQRIIDVLTGALVALEGECKKVGDKQYIFSLNAQMSGAIDYVPQQGSSQNQYMFGTMNNQNSGMGMPFSFDNNFDQYNQNMGVNNFNQGMPNIDYMNQNQYQNYNNQYNPNVNMNNNQNINNNSFNPQDYYKAPMTQF